MEADQLPNREGNYLKSKYRLEKRLGVGGMGEVYRARNVMVDRTVAIKLLHKDLAANRDVVERFLLEARAANFVHHPNVVDILDIDVDEGGIPFIVQEYLEGEDLGTRLDKQGGKMPVRTVLRMLLPIVKAIGVAHQKGVVHRDLKPENIFLSWQGEVIVPKVLDFGISKMPVKKGNTRLTMTGTVLGSPAYMSPEQIQDSQSVDVRTDIWAIGVMLYKLLSGRLPFDSDSPSALFVKVCTTNAEPLENVQADLPPRLLAAVGRCMRHSPNERFADANELFEELNQILIQLSASDLAATERGGAPAPREALPKAAAPLQKEINPASSPVAPGNKPEMPAVAAAGTKSKRADWGELDSTHASQVKAHSHNQRAEPKSASTPKPAAAARVPIAPLGENIEGPELQLATEPAAARVTTPRPAIKDSGARAKSTGLIPPSPVIRARVGGGSMTKEEDDSINLDIFVDILLATLLVLTVALSRRYLEPPRLEELRTTLGSVVYAPFLIAALIFFIGSIPLGAYCLRLSSPTLLLSELGLLGMAACVSIYAWSIIKPESNISTIYSIAFVAERWAAAAVPLGFAAYGILSGIEKIQHKSGAGIVKGIIILFFAAAALITGIRLISQAIRNESAPKPAQQDTGETTMIETPSETAVAILTEKF